jgi:hypothetical protein
MFECVEGWKDSLSPILLLSSQKYKQARPAAIFAFLEARLSFFFCAADL